MAQDRKPTLFASLFGSKKRTEEEIEAEQQSRQKLEERIREVLVVMDPPKFEPALTIWASTPEHEVGALQQHQ